MMNKLDDIKIGNKYRSLVNNDVFEIINIYLGIDNQSYVLLKDKKGKKYELSFNTFIRQRLEKIEE